MNKILIIVGIISLIVGVVFFLNYDTLFSDKEKCDKLLYRDVQYALCYENDKIAVTTQHVNIYKATETKRGRYDRIEVFDRPGGKIVRTYKGELYFGLRAECI